MTQARMATSGPVCIMRAPCLPGAKTHSGGILPGMLTMMLCSVVLAAPIESQDESGATGEVPAGLGQDPESPFDLEWSLSAGYAYQLRTSIDAGGRMTWGRAHAQLNGRTPLPDDLELTVGLRWQHDAFDFESAAPTWGDVSTWQADVALQWQASAQWQIFGGGQLIAAAADDDLKFVERLSRR